MRAIKVAALGLSLAACVSSLVAGQPSGGQGRNVWDGAYTPDQATRGGISYSANCAECHGANLQGGEGKALRGDQFWSDWRESTVGELLTYISKNMPYAEDGSRAGTLSPGIYAEIVAHILEKNDLPEIKKWNDILNQTAKQIAFDKFYVPDYGIMSLGKFEYQLSLDLREITAYTEKILNRLKEDEIKTGIKN